MSRASSVTFSWRGDDFQAALEPALNQGLDRATIWATRQMARESSKRYPGVRRKVSKRTGRVYFPGPGAPRKGYPGLRSGQLVASMMHEPARGLRARFGASVHYARHVHRDRPFIALTFSRFGRQIEDQFVEGAKRRLAQATSLPHAEGAD